MRLERGAFGTFAMPGLCDLRAQPSAWESLDTGQSCFFKEGNLAGKEPSWLSTVSAFRLKVSALAQDGLPIGVPDKPSRVSIVLQRSCAAGLRTKAR